METLKIITLVSNFTSMLLRDGLVQLIYLISILSIILFRSIFIHLCNFPHANMKATWKIAKIECKSKNENEYCLLWEFSFSYNFFLIVIRVVVHYYLLLFINFVVIRC